MFYLKSENYCFNSFSGVGNKGVVIGGVVGVVVGVDMGFCVFSDYNCPILKNQNYSLNSFSIGTHF